MSWKHLFEIYFRLLRRNNELKINNFLTSIWRDKWSFSIWRRKRTPSMAIIEFEDLKKKQKKTNVWNQQNYIGGKVRGSKALYKSKKMILLPILLRSMLFVMLEKKSKTCNKKMLINLSWNVKLKRGFSCGNWNHKGA